MPVIGSGRLSRLSRLGIGIGESGSAGLLRVFVREGGNNIVDVRSTESYSDNKWHFFAIVNDDVNQVKMYVDGVDVTPEEPIANSNSWFDSVTNKNTLRMGHDPINTLVSINGSMDEFRIYNRALSPSEVKQLYQWAPGPVGYWDFNEGSGTTAFDKSGNGLNGTISNAVYTTGKYGSALGNPVNDTMEAATVINNSLFRFNDTQSFSYGGWVKIDGSDSTGFIIRTGSNNTSTPGYTLLIPSSNFARCSYSDGDGLGADNVTGITDIADGNWHHVVVVRNGSVVTIYVDGKYDNSATGTTIELDNSISTHIGYDIRANSLGFEGQIDHVKIYDYARTPAQIAYDYNRGEPIAHYKFDEGEETTIHNSSRELVDGSLDGTLTVTTTGGNSAGVGTCNTANSAWGSGANGKFGASLNFDGDGDYVANASTVWPALNTISVSAWFKKSSGNSGTIFSKDMAGFSPTAFDLAVDDRIRLTTYTGGCTYPDNRTDVSGVKTGLNDNSWHHVVALYNGTDLLIYVDGKLDKTQAATTTGEVCNAYNGWSIGARRISGLGSFFLGLIDEVQIFNYALSPAQVRKLYNGGAAIRFGE